MTPGPEAERPEAPVPTRPPTPWYRRPAVVVLVVLAVALVLSVIEANRVEHDEVPAESTDPGGTWHDVGPMPQDPEDIVLSPVVAAGMRETQTDPAAWSHVAGVQVQGRTVVIYVSDTTSKAMALRVCEQAHRYLFPPYSYNPKLDKLIILNRFSQGPRASGSDNTDGCKAAMAQ